MKCDRCEQDATIHITEIRRGLSYERHLCETCAEMLLPMEESDYAEYLEVLPPRDAADASDEPEPTAGELGMTGLHQRVVVVEIDTGEMTPVGLHKGDSSSPVWSPDSTRLALCHTIETLYSLVLVLPGSAWQRRFLRTAYAEPASWSHDGARVAFSHPEDDGVHILTADVDEGTLRRLPKSPYVSASSPVCSPSDDRVAFAGLAMAGENPDTAWCSVFTASVASEETRRVFTLDATFVLRVDWSGDARYLAAVATPFTRFDIEQPFGAPVAQTLHLARADAEDAADTALDGKVLSFAWVPGPALLVTRPTRDPFTCNAVLIDPATRDARTVARRVAFPGRAAETCHLSPDGSTLLALGPGDDQQIRCLDVAGGSVKTVDARGEVVGLSWHPSGETFAALIRTPRGARIEMITAEGDRREVVAFDREVYFDVPRMVLSPDGTRAAVEVHLPRKDASGS